MTVRADQGSASFFAIVVATVGILASGLIVDTGRLFAAKRAASSWASSSARAGAAVFDRAALADGRRTLDPLAARSAALRTAGAGAAEVVVGCAATGCDRVRVTVTERVELAVLGSRTVVATETARIAVGVSVEGG